MKDAKCHYKGLKEGLQSSVAKPTLTQVNWIPKNEFIKWKNFYSYRSSNKLKRADVLMIKLEHLNFGFE